MGGNLYKTGRITKERYLEILSSLLPILDRHFGKHYRIPVAYRSKPDYGDVDIIVDATFVRNKEWLEPLIEDLEMANRKQVEVKKVRNIVSVLYMNFQVDFFLLGESMFEMTYHFMSYNILGNLLGRIFHKFNLKYGEDGLKYVLRGYNDRVSKEIYLSRDMKQILGFLDLSYDRWAEGFDEVEEIFNYVINCKYFTSNSYDEKYFNVRKRATERPDFNKFLDYLKKNGIEKNYSFYKEKELYIPMIEKYFPESKLSEKYKIHLFNQKIAKEVAEKFNGRTIMRVLNVTDGTIVGDRIGKIKAHYGDAFEDFILKSTQEEIDAMIKQF